MMEYMMDGLAAKRSGMPESINQSINPPLRPKDSKAKEYPSAAAKEPIHPSFLLSLSCTHFATVAWMVRAVFHILYSVCQTDPHLSTTAATATATTMRTILYTK
jgi:hypothetical protein